MTYFLQQHQENECPAYPVLCDKCNKEGIPRGKVSFLKIIKHPGGHFLTTTTKKKPPVLVHDYFATNTVIEIGLLSPLQKGV